MAGNGRKQLGEPNVLAGRACTAHHRVVSLVWVVSVVHPGALYTCPSYGRCGGVWSTCEHLHAMYLSALACNVPVKDYPNALSICINQVKAGA